LSGKVYSSGVHTFPVAFLAVLHNALAHVFINRTAQNRKYVLLISLNITHIEKNLQIKVVYSNEICILLHVYVFCTMSRFSENIKFSV